MESPDKEMPSITVTRDLDEQDYSPTENTLDSVIITNSGSSAGLFPPSLFLAARSSNPVTQRNVEDFIQSRLESFAPPPTSCRCSTFVRSVEESLECPVCRDRVEREVYQ